MWFQNARAKDKKSRNNRFADEAIPTQNSNVTPSSIQPANMALVRELLTSTKDKCMVNGVFNHFFVPQVAATNSSEEDLEEENDKIEENKNQANTSSAYPYYNNYGKKELCVCFELFFILFKINS